MSRSLIILPSQLYKKISYRLYVRGLLSPTGHSLEDTDIWFSSYDNKFEEAGAFAMKRSRLCESGSGIIKKTSTFR